MAAGVSGRGSYWVGALVGLVFSGSLAAVLSLVSPLPLGDDSARAPGTVSESAGSSATQPAAVTAASGQSSEDASAAVAAPEPSTESASTAQPAATASAQGGVSEPVDVSTDEAATTGAAGSTGAAAETEETQVALAAPEPADPAPTPSETQPATTTATAPVDEEPADSIAENTLPPYKANAEIYSGDRSQPLLAIVLTDVNGADPVQLDELLLLPGPLAIVVPSTSERLEDTVLDVRDAGFEALVGLQDAASGATVSERLDAGGALLGAAIFDGAEAGGLEDVLGVLGEGGYAFLDLSSTVGGASYRAARDRDVPAAQIGRRFDEIDSSAMVFQSLERAAFDARRTGAFIVVGKATPAILTGLRRWMNVKADKSVAVAPLSTVIDKIGRQ